MITGICRSAAAVALVGLVVGCGSGQAVRTVTTTATASAANAPASSSSQAPPSAPPQTSPTVTSHPLQTQSSPAQTSQPAGGSPVDALSNYWRAINTGDYRAAYGYLGPGQDPKSTWVSAHEAAGIQSATFSGTATSVSNATATVRVDFLQTQDQTSGCRTWSGNYQMIEQGGSWLIAKAEITPSPCSGAAPAPSPPTSTSGPGVTDFCSAHTCIPNFPNGAGYIVQCADGEWSHSGGLSGACSDHGGETATRYP